MDCPAGWRKQNTYITCLCLHAACCMITHVTSFLALFHDAPCRTGCRKQIRHTFTLLYTSLMCYRCVYSVPMHRDEVHYCHQTTEAMGNVEDWRINSNPRESQLGFLVLFYTSLMCYPFGLVVTGFDVLTYASCITCVIMVR